MTEAPLRAFLMVRSRDGTWTVTVCRDLGAVMRAWKMRKELDWDVAVLHVGFDRPPSHSFDEVAQAHPGRILLTTAAKHVVPASFVSSAAPVGAVESIDVFIGLQGWGYTLDDPTAGAEQVEPPRPDTVIHEPHGWVASFLHEYPSDAESGIGTWNIRRRHLSRPGSGTGTKRPAPRRTVSPSSHRRGELRRPVRTCPHCAAVAGHARADLTGTYGAGPTTSFRSTAS